MARVGAFSGRSRAAFWLAGLGAVGCGAGLLATAGNQWATAPRGPATVAPPPPAAATVARAHAAPAAPRELAAGADFEKLRAKYEDMTYAKLADELRLRRAPDVPPSFDPTGVAYYAKVDKALQLTAEEHDIYRRTGLVGVDHGRHLTMASTYLAIYQADLPVLVTADSILHAMHRSFDDILVELETGDFTREITEALVNAHGALAQRAASVAGSRALEQSARDADLYLSVALSLMDGKPTASIFNQDGDVAAVLEAIGALRPELHFHIYGGVRPIDWSQFQPRGHYTKSPLLEHYFQSMMWLGRADTGFVLASPAARAGIRPDVARERRDAALLALLFARSGQLEALAKVDRAIRFFVGASDTTGPADVAAALERAGIKDLPDLASEAALDRAARELLATRAGAQRIRSQVIDSDPGDTVQTPVPDTFQLFGQRFVIDSFVLSKVVYDAILFKGEKQTRTMPAGLDVMAALGNDEAVALLEPALEKDNYAANLMASRAFVERQPPAIWNESVYNIWLSALAKLDDVPRGTNFPEAMRGRAWQAKQLQTQLGSWAELRHDTILYAAQSYTSMIACEYPTGYVEPYPELWARLALFGEQGKGWLEATGLSTPQRAAFFDFFAATTRHLEKLARKELAGEPFDGDDRKFVKDTISVQWRGGGCGPPTKIYSGWYPQMIYGGAPESWEPTIADVHTDPNTGQVLEVGVGDANFLVVAVDNAGDRAAYVGPVYSYYEIASPARLTDEEWRAKIKRGDLPPRPEWTHAFQAAAVKRTMPMPMPK
jgi:hypothetical protein